MWFCVYKGVYEQITGSGETPELAFTDVRDALGDVIDPEDCTFYLGEEKHVTVTQVWTVKEE